MKIGLISAPWVPVPPLRYGGSEAVIDVLARGLQATGQDVSLFATGDSTCPVPTGSVYRAALGTPNITVAAEARQVVHAYDWLAACDLVHDHTLYGPLYAAERTDAALVTTSHGPFTAELGDLYTKMAHDGVAVVAISHHQRSTAPHVPVAAVIHHGMDVGRVPFGRGEGGYAVFLGRMSPDKGADRAIRVARAAGVPLVLAAKMWEPEEHSYFVEQVEPLLSGDAVYIGEIDETTKFKLLGDAVALLNPIRWPEPFGLVMIEALAAGTPVLAFREGAAPEIVEHGVTGFLCDDEHEMATALASARDLRRDACRASAALRFSTERMVDDYLRLYKSLIEERPPARTIELDKARIGRTPDAVVTGDVASHL